MMWSAGAGVVGGEKGKGNGEEKDCARVKDGY
jgi:hypothetical protein